MTASHFTPRLSLPYPDENDPADVPLDIQNLAVKLDGLVARTPGIVATALPVLDVGQVGQVRAGRQLTVADFTNLGLSAPAGLWNLSDLTDASGNGRALVNKGAVPFGVGINGAASTAAVFAGSTAQALYISDTGAADPFRIRTGSFGCWMRTAKRTQPQAVFSRDAAAARGFLAWITAGNVVEGDVSLDGSTSFAASGVSDVADDRWHMVAVVFDGAALRLYVDAALEAVTQATGAMFPSAAPLNIGAQRADGATAATNPHYGRVDEAFVTADVLSDDQVRALYCAKLAHGFSVTPTAVNLAVRRQRKGAAFIPADFPTAPLRLHNFTAGSLTDQGSGGVALTNNGAAVSVSGADGTNNGAFNFVQASLQSLSSTDAGLPSGTAARSYGCWFKTSAVGLWQTALAWGTAGTADANIWLSATTGTVSAASGSDTITGPFALDGQWHFAVCVEDNAAGDGVKRKFYVDGRCVGGSTVLTPITLAGVNHFRVGATAAGANTMAGQIDGAFVCDYALTSDRVIALYAKGSQALAASVKNAGDHVEAMDAASVYLVCDTLDSQHQIDLGVTG